MQNRIYSMDNSKAIKAQGFGWLNAIHYMAPADLAGVGNLCPAVLRSGGAPGPPLPPPAGIIPSQNPVFP